MIRGAICDDEPTVLDYLYAQISTEFKRQDVNVHIDTFTMGKDFLNAYKAEPFDVFFLDIRMADIDGFDVSAELRKLSENV